MKSNLNEMTIFLLFILLFESTTTKNLNQINENLVLSIKDHKKRNEIILKHLNNIKSNSPKLPDKIPNELIFMQKKLLQAYRIVYKDPYLLNNNIKSSSRFKQKEDNNRSPYFMNRDKYSDEEKVEISKAWSNSVYSYRYLIWKKSYPANNAINGINKYWCSKPVKKMEKIVTWEATLRKRTRVHGINIIWAYAPGTFNIEYSVDGKEFKTVIDWRRTVSGGNRKWWEMLIPSLKQSFKSFPDRITFDSPIVAKKIRIKMREPVNKFFGLYKVEFFARNWVVLIKSKIPASSKEDCWSVNVKDPRPGSKVESVDCISSITISDNRELFIFTPKGLIIHYVSGLCVTTGSDKDLTLMNCSDAAEKNDGRNIFFPGEDGAIVSEYDEQDCIIMKENSAPRNWAYKARIEASSTLNDGAHDGYRSVDGNFNTFWASSPGTNSVTFKMFFEEYITADTLLIKFKYIARDFDIFIHSYEKGWRHFLKVKGNNLREKKINLKKLNIKAIEINMTKAFERINNQPVYGISDIIVNDGGAVLSRKKCKKIEEEYLRNFSFDEQEYRVTSSLTDYVKELNKLSLTYIKLRSFKNKLMNEWKSIPGTQSQAKHIEVLIKESTLSIESLLERNKVFKSIDINKKNLHLIKIVKNNQFENYFHKPSTDVKRNIGVSPKSPASDCFQIKEIYKTKKSGYYYIQPPCSFSPIRVFCDFSVTPHGLSIYIFNNNQLPNTHLDSLKISSFLDIRYHCASKGLYPIEINNLDTTKRITQLLTTYGWDLSFPLTIPLGYDYNCEKGTCINSYNSINREDTDPILPYLTQLDNDNLSTEEEPKNTIGLGFNRDGTPYTFDLKNSNVTALVCSTNYNENNEDPSVIKISCSDSLLTNPKLDSEINSEIKVSCPSFCSQETKGQIIGTGTYSGDSSICKAGIHAGIIRDLHGGVLLVKISPSKRKFIGSRKSGITSKNSKHPSAKTFILLKNKEKCPIDFLKHLYSTSSSFLELENGALNQLQITELEDLKTKFHLEKLENDQLSDEISKLTKSAMESLGEIKNLPDEKNKSSQKQLDKSLKDEKDLDAKDSFKDEKPNLKKDILDEDFDKKDKKFNSLKAVKKAAKKAAKKSKKIVKDLNKMKKKLLKGKKKGKKKGKNQKKKNKKMLALKNLLGALKNSTKIKKKPKKKYNQTSLINTDKAIKLVRTMRTEESKEFTQFNNYGIFMNHVINKFNNELSYSRNPSVLSREVLKNNYLSLMISIKKLNELSKTIHMKSNSRLEYTKSIHSKLQDKYVSLESAEAYSLKYKSLNSFWEKYDNKASDNGPSNWSTIDSNLNKRKISIAQTSLIKSKKGKYASFFILKNKVYSDFKLKLDVMVRSNQACGVIFRARDIYNFYAFELNQKHGFKRLVKVENGVYKVLEQVKDGGITQNQWFKIFIQTRLQNLIISFGDSETYQKYSQLPKIFNIEETVFRQGTIGLFTNGNNQFYVDKLRVKPVTCWTPWEVKPKGIKIINSRANYYLESYKGNFAKKYMKIDPKNSKGGSGDWKIKKHYHNRENAIRQASEIRDNSPDRDHSMFILRNKYIKKGSFSVDFLAENNGVVGLVFKFVDPNNYLLFEVGGFEKRKRFFQLRKKTSGINKVIARINNKKDVRSKIFGYKKFIWYRVRIELNKYNIKVFISIPGQNEFLIFDENDKDIPYGKVGISTSHTQAGFDNLMIKPKVEEKKSSFIGTAPNIDDENDDLFMYENRRENKDKKEQVSVGQVEGKHFNRYDVCLGRRTPDDRRIWCGLTFNSNYILKKRCNLNYCGVCCKKNVPSIQKLDLYHCEKTCNSLSVASSSEETNISWHKLCFVSPNPERNMYSYCENNFSEVIARQNCKIDGCRMCCVNSDNILNTDMSTNSLNECFMKCSKEFTYDPESND